jgi:DNA-binding CsgD family transcriptional regulator
VSLSMGSEPVVVLSERAGCGSSEISWLGTNIGGWGRASGGQYDRGDSARPCPFCSGSLLDPARSFASLVVSGAAPSTDWGAKVATTVIEPLTNREREVLGFLPSHFSTRQIATAIYLSPNTVKTHMKAIYRKMGAASRSEAVAIAVGRGLL